MIKYEFNIMELQTDSLVFASVANKLIMKLESP